MLSGSFFDKKLKTCNREKCKETVRHKTGKVC